MWTVLQHPPLTLLTLHEGVVYINEGHVIPLGVH